MHAADIKATPVAAAIIADKKVDKGTITPSGSNGKIVKHDVLEALTNPGRLPGKALFSRDVRKGENEQSAENGFPPTGRSKEYNGHAHHF